MGKKEMGVLEEMGKEVMVVALGMAVGEMVWMMEKEGMVTEVRVAKGIHMVGDKGSRILRSPKCLYLYHIRLCSFEGACN